MKKTFRHFCVFMLVAACVLALMPSAVLADSSVYKITELTPGQKLTSADSVTSETTKIIFIFGTLEEAAAATGGDGFMFRGEVFSFSPFVPEPIYFVKAYSAGMQDIGYYSITFVKLLDNGDGAFYLSDGRESPLVSYPVAANLTYTGEPQDLIAAPAVTKDPAVKVYYRASGSDWSESIPQGVSGRYSLYMKVDSGNTGYTDIPAINAGTVYIDPRPVTVRSDNASKHVGESDPAAFSYTVVSGSIVGEDTLDLTLTRAEGEAPGSYNIDITKGNNPNYDITISDEKGVFTITPHEWSYTADANVITASCGVEACRYHDGDELRLELTVPQDAVYWGGDFAAAVTNSISEVTGAEPGPVIYRDKEQNTVAQVNMPGTYTAEVTLGSATAVDTFTVAKADQVLEADDLKLYAGDRGKTIPYSLTGVENGAECGAVTFTLVSGDGIITVDDDGKVSGRKVGTAVVRIAAAENDYYNGAETTVTVTVKAVPANGIRLDQTELTLQPDESVKLTATVLPENATNKAVTWKSSDTQIALVSADGTVTAVNAGTATITATSRDCGLTATCSVTVEAHVTGVSLDQTELTLQPGESAELTATVLPENAVDKTVTWESSDTQIVLVSADGTVTAVSAGTATVTVTTADGGLTAACSVTVEAHAQQQEAPEGDDRIPEESSEQDSEKDAGQDPEKSSAQDSEKDAGQDPEKNAGQNPEKNAGQDPEKNAESGTEKNAGQKSSPKTGLIIAAVILVCAVLLIVVLFLKKRKK